MITILNEELRSSTFQFEEKRVAKKKKRARGFPTNSDASNKYNVKIILKTPSGKEVNKCRMCEVDSSKVDCGPPEDTFILETLGGSSCIRFSDIPHVYVSPTCLPSHHSTEMTPDLNGFLLHFTISNEKHIFEGEVTLEYRKNHSREIPTPRRDIETRVRTAHQMDNPLLGIASNEPSSGKELPSLSNLDVQRGWENRQVSILEDNLPANISFPPPHNDNLQDNCVQRDEVREWVERALTGEKPAMIEEVLTKFKEKGVTTVSHILALDRTYLREVDLPLGVEAVLFEKISDEREKKKRKKEEMNSPSKRTSTLELGRAVSNVTVSTVQCGNFSLEWRSRREGTSKLSDKTIAQNSNPVQFIPTFLIYTQRNMSPFPCLVGIDRGTVSLHLVKDSEVCSDFEISKHSKNASQQLPWFYNSKVMKKKKKRTKQQYLLKRTLEIRWEDQNTKLLLWSGLFRLVSKPLPFEDPRVENFQTKLGLVGIENEVSFFGFFPESPGEVTITFGDKKARLIDRNRRTISVRTQSHHVAEVVMVKMKFTNTFEAHVGDYQFVDAQMEETLLSSISVGDNGDNVTFSNFPGGNSNLPPPSSSSSGESGSNSPSSNTNGNYDASHGFNNVHHFAVDGKLQELEALLDRDPKLVNLADHRGRTALYWAAVAQQEESAKLLLEKGADVNAAEFYGLTPLHVAVARNNPSMAILLLSHGANPNATTDGEDGFSPLDYAEGDQWKQTAEKILNDNYSPASMDVDADEMKDNTLALETLKLQTEFLITNEEEFKEILSKADNRSLPRLFITTRTFNEGENKYLAPFRAAVSIGDQVIEADPNGFASASNFESSTLISVPMELPNTSIEKAIDQVSKALSEWNKTNLTTPCELHQLPFIVLKNLDLPLSSLQKLEELFAQLVKTDVLKPVFNFRDETIISHAQLDSLVWNLREEDDEEEILTEDEELLLKVMDRVYWVRYFGILNSSLSAEEKKEALGNCRAANCPFGNPAETQTLIGHEIEIPEEEQEYFERLKQLRY